LEISAVSCPGRARGKADTALKRLVYRALCVPQLGLPWIENLRRDKPLKLLRADPPDGSKMRLERWYYFWVNNTYTDPMVLIRNGENWWTVHPGINRWIAASLRPSPDREVLLISNRPLINLRGDPEAIVRAKHRLVPPDIHSIKLCGLSDLQPYTRPHHVASDWTGQPAKTTWDQWHSAWNELADKIKKTGQGRLALMDGNRCYTMGQGEIIGCWQVKDGDDGINEITSMFVFADSLGWNRL